MIKYCLFILALCYQVIGFGQDPIEGLWTTIDDETGEASSIIRVEISNNQLTATVQELLTQAQDLLCEKCKGDRYNQPIVGMQILNDLQLNGKTWSGGTILDPKVGKEFKCKIELSKPNQLKIRGYIGIPVIGRTQYWERMTD